MADRKPPRWDRLYARHFPVDTDGYSRHVRLIATDLRSKRSPLRKLLADAGYEPDHLAESMEQTVVMLWRTRELMRTPGNSGDGHGVG